MSPRDEERAVIRAAYLEWLIALAYSTGQTPDVEPRAPQGEVPPEICAYLSGSWPGRGFISGELGMGIGEGPSIFWTMKTLARQNRDAVIALGDEAPMRVSYPKRARS